MNNLEYISEGYYRNRNSGQEYMSIWTFKQNNGMGRGSNDENYNDAKNIRCIDKHWMPFSQSENFKSGYVYNVIDLKEFYEK
jgi:hypothetical protein